MNSFGDWVWQSLQQLSTVAPLGTLLAVMVGYFSYRGTIRQKTLADNRSSWWNRVQWAIDASLSEDKQRRVTGLAALGQMQDSPLADAADQVLLTAMANEVVAGSFEYLGLDEEAGLVVDLEPAAYYDSSDRGGTGHDE